MGLRGILEGVPPDPQGANFDIWDPIDREVDRRPPRHVEVRRVPSHLTAPQAKARGYSEQDRLRNAAADVGATDACRRHSDVGPWVRRSVVCSAGMERLQR